MARVASGVVMRRPALFKLILGLFFNCSLCMLFPVLQFLSEDWSIRSGGLVGVEMAAATVLAIYLAICRIGSDPLLSSCSLHLYLNYFAHPSFDSVLFYTPEYSWYILCSLNWMKMKAVT